MNGNSNIIDVLKEEPQDFEVENVIITLPNPEDFPGFDINDVSNESEDPKETDQEEVETDENETQEDPEENEKEEKLTPEEKSRKERLQQVKKEVIQSLIEPETIIAFTDMGMSRVCSLVPGSKRDDWKLDKEEKEIFSKLLEATVEEEGVEFWPAKTWMFIAIIFVYGFKGFEVWDIQKERKDEENLDPKTAQEKGEKEIAYLEVIADIERRKKELKDEISEMQGSQNGNINIPDDQWVYDAKGNHVLNKDGTKKRKPGSHWAKKRKEDGDSEEVIQDVEFEDVKEKTHEE